MSESPYAPPASNVADRQPLPGPPRPKQVVIAVRLLWISLGLGVPVAYLAAVREPDVGFNPVILAIMLASLVFSAVLNVLIYRGRNWARIVTLLLVLVSAYFLFLPPEEPTPPDFFEQLLNVVSFALDLSATYLLFSRSGAPWFRRREE